MNLLFWIDIIVGNCFNFKGRKSMKGLVSIIVPVYNTEKYLEDCIESLIMQTYEKLQIILVDDGSTDGSGDICDDYSKKDSRIQVIHQNNQGVSTARNAGIQLAKGEYLTFVDSDDTLTSNAMEIALKILHQDQADMVTYGWHIIREDGSVEQACRESRVTMDIPGAVKEMLMHYSAYGGGYPWNKLWRREVFRDELPVFNSNLYYFEDMEWVVRMLLRIRKIAVCQECLYSYYIRENSITHLPEKAERREVCYHLSVEKIIEDLSVMPALQTWFVGKYYPEIVNGVIYARRHNYKTLQKCLMEKMMQSKEEILAADSVSGKIKLRCKLLSLLAQLHIL